MRPVLKTSLPCLVLALLASCIVSRPPGTAFSSEPPGARVRVDGHDSGWVTPCQIALADDQAHVVTLALEGYLPREILLTPEKRLGIVAWRQGVNGVRSTIRFPILLPASDLLLPLREVRALAPGRVFVRLRPEGAP